MSGWIDITRPIDETLVTWPGRARPQRRWEKRIAEGQHCNASFWELSAHSGTHMDAPLHFVDGGKSIDQISPEVFIGECRVCDSAVLDEATARRLAGVKRLLIKTGDADGCYEPLMTETIASLLIEGGLVLLGTERLSIDDSRGQSFCLHHLFLGAGCVIVEGLLLGDVQDGSYRLSAAPLRLTGTEASPVRAFLQSTKAVPR